MWPKRYRQNDKQFRPWSDCSFSLTGSTLLAKTCLAENVGSLQEINYLNIFMHYSNSAHLYRWWKRTVFYSATIHWAEERDAYYRRCCMFYDVSLRFLDVRIKNVRNICKCLRYCQSFGGIFSVQWRKVGRIWKIQLLFHKNVAFYNGEIVTF